jgi:hypothetical protein
MRSLLGVSFLVFGLISPVRAEECACYWQMRSPVLGDLDSLLTKVYASHWKRGDLTCLETCTAVAVEHLRDTIEPSCRYKSEKNDPCALLELRLHVDVALSDEVKVGSTDALRKPYVTADACTNLGDVKGRLRGTRRHDLRACEP